VTHWVVVADSSTLVKGLGEIGDAGLLAQP
jgi:hypothetical protein